MHETCVARLIDGNLITEEEQVRRGVYQKFHKRLPDYLCLFGIRHQHVHQTVEWEERCNLGDDE